jgi:hypothetical protein
MIVPCAAVNSPELSEWASMSLRGMQALRFTPHLDIGNPDLGYPIEGSFFYNDPEYSRIVTMYQQFEEITSANLCFGDMVVVMEWMNSSPGETYPLMEPFTGHRHTFHIRTKRMKAFLNSTYICYLMFVGMAASYETFMNISTPSPMFIFMIGHGNLPDYESSILKGCYIPIKCHVSTYLKLKRSTYLTLGLINRIHIVQRHTLIEHEDVDEDVDDDDDDDDDA